jgi:hypothetical protein
VSGGGVSVGGVLECVGSPPPPPPPHPQIRGFTTAIPDEPIKLSLSTCLAVL